jgi:hypothetical protein
MWGELGQIPNSFAFLLRGGQWPLAAPLFCYQPQPAGFYFAKFSITKQNS